jgi:hypothetical protein
LLLPRRTAFADRVDDRVYVSLLDPHEDRGVGFTQKPADGLDPCCSETTVRELRKQPIDIFGLDYRYDKLHDVNSSRSAIVRQISSDN